MKDQRDWNKPCWYLAQTHSRQEDRAEGNLKSYGVETFAPRVIECKYNLYTGEATPHIKPLFPSYIFARFKLDDLYYKVRYTRGIRQLISFGDYPTVIGEEIITEIQSRIKEDGFVRIDEALIRGDEVIIKDGPFKNLAGVFDREVKGADRVRILLQTVSYQAHLVIQKDLVKKSAQ